MGDGTYKCVSWPGERHYWNWKGKGDGEVRWRQLDCEPVESPEGWTVQYAPHTITIPRYADTPLQFCDLHSDGENHREIPYTIEPIGVGHVEGIRKEWDIVYTDAYGPGAHLVYRIAAFGVQKLIRVDTDSPATGPFQFDYHLPEGFKVVRRGKDSEYDLQPQKKQLDTGKLTVFTNGQETYLAPFRWWDGPMMHTLSVEIEQVGSAWRITKSLPTEWTRENVLEMDVSSASTLGKNGQMGWGSGALTYNQLVTANASSGASSQYGDGTGTTKQFLVYAKGNAGTKYNVRGYAEFANTVPASATITACDVGVYIETDAGAGARIVEHNPDNYAAVDNDDYNSYGGGSDPTVRVQDTNLATAKTNPVGTGAKTFSLSVLTEINKNANTGYAFRTAGASCDTGTGGGYAGVAIYLKFSTSGNATSSRWPSETITYTLPDGAVPSGLMLMGVG